MNPLEAPYRVWVSDDKLSPVQLTAERHFRLYPASVNGDVDKTLLPRQIDLARLAIAVHVADGLLRRRRRDWGFRSPRLEIEVLDHAFWAKAEVSEALKACLDFLSGDDDWTITFRADPFRYNRQSRFDFAGPKPVVCLYSSGLDSAAGLPTRLRERGDQEFIPVTVRHQFQRGKSVRKQFAFLRDRAVAKPGQLRPFIAGAFVRNRRLQRELGLRTVEVTHRCRSFLFTAVAGIVAWVEGADEVELYESGIGAVNLPLSPGMIGWQTTRSTHPRFLRLMSDLVSLVAEQGVTFTLPFLHPTKTEMVSELAKHDLGALATMSVSCIMHPLRRGNRKQCGYCPACVYRRYALLTAGLHDPANISYHTDLFPSTEQPVIVPPKRLNPLNTFIEQVVRLGQLTAGNIPGFFRRHLLGTQVVEHESALRPFVELFRRYRCEWLALAELGRAYGWPWADRLPLKPLVAVG
jgi:7-cyano-7-deazaguanine synthase in queuosine biosynthesis